MGDVQYAQATLAEPYLIGVGVDYEPLCWPSLLNRPNDIALSLGLLREITAKPRCLVDIWQVPPKTELPAGDVVAFFFRQPRFHTMLECLADHIVNEENSPVKDGLLARGDDLLMFLQNGNGAPLPVLFRHVAGTRKVLADKLNLNGMVRPRTVIIVPAGG